MISFFFTLLKTYWNIFVLSKKIKIKINSIKHQEDWCDLYLLNYTPKHTMTMKKKFLGLKYCPGVTVLTIRNKQSVRKFASKYHNILLNTSVFDNRQTNGRTSNKMIINVLLGFQLKWAKTFFKKNKIRQKSICTYLPLIKWKKKTCMYLVLKH